MMSMNSQRRLLPVAVLAMALFAAPDARAQSDYPNNTVRIVVESAPGSANDSTSRVLGDRLSKVWNQPVVTLNQPGAGGGDRQAKRREFGQQRMRSHAHRSFGFGTCLTYQS